MMRSRIAEDHQPPGWLKESLGMLMPLNRTQVMAGPGTEETTPHLVVPDAGEWSASQLDVETPCDERLCMARMDGIHLEDAVVLNPDPNDMPVTRAGSARVAGLNMALLYHGLVKVVPGRECTVRREAGLGGPAQIIEHTGAQALWWAWTAKSPGWYTPDGKPVEVQVRERLEEGQRAIALEVPGTPRGIGFTFKARRAGGGPRTNVRTEFDEPVADQRIWNVSRWVRIIPAPNGSVVPEAVAEMERRYTQLTRSTAIHSAKAGIGWCGEYEDAMRNLGVAERHYRRLVVPIRYKLRLNLLYRLSEEDLAALTKERWGGDGHTVTSTLSWYSQVEIEVQVPSNRNPGDAVIKSMIDEAGYTGFSSWSVERYEEIGPVEGEAEDAPQEEVTF